MANIQVHMKSLIKTHLKRSRSQFLLSNLTIILSIFAFATCAISTPAFAKQKWYQVELILFSINNSEEAYTESWPESPDILNVINKIELLTPANVRRLDNQNNNTNVKQTQYQASQPVQTIVPFATVNKSEHRLTVTANKLKNSPKYDLLLHVGWRQPAFRSKDKSAVYLHDGADIPTNKAQLLSTHRKNSDAARQITEFDDEGISGLVAEKLGNTIDTRNNLNPGEPGIQRFFGTLKLSLSRFLHIDIDMKYRGLMDRSAPSPINIQTDIQKNAAENVNNEFQTSFDSIENLGGPDFENIKLLTPQDYRLQTSRRVKPGEIHFFDHPIFGLITMVTRYALPKPEEEESTTNMQPFIP